MKTWCCDGWHGQTLFFRASLVTKSSQVGYALPTVYLDLCGEFVRMRVDEIHGNVLSMNKLPEHRAFPSILDFFCNKLKLALELDGYTHTFEEIAAKEAIKQERLKAVGITVLRFRNKDVMKNTEGVLQVIRCFIEDHEKRKENTLNLSF